MVKKIWNQEVKTKQDDEALKLAIKQVEGFKWAKIARILQDKFGVHGKTRRQCRDRWLTKLDPNLSHVEWTSFDLSRLFQLQSIFGNKWALIASCMPGRSENDVKNHYYSHRRKFYRALKNIK